MIENYRHLTWVRQDSRFYDGCMVRSRDVILGAEDRNRFLYPEPGVADRVADVLKQIRAVERSLPVTSLADGDSYYGVAPGRSFHETQMELRRSVSQLLVVAYEYGRDGLRVTPALVVELHAGLFLPVFGERTLAFRTRPRRGSTLDDDGVVFPIWVVSGTGQPPRIRVVRGVRSGQVGPSVERACSGFERGVSIAAGDRGRSAWLLAQLYSRLIRAHPFLDGNGRTAWVMAQLAAGRLGMPLVESSPTTDARIALGRAVRDGNDLRPLAGAFSRAMGG